MSFDTKTFVAGVTVGSLVALAAAHILPSPSFCRTPKSASSKKKSLAATTTTTATAATSPYTNNTANTNTDGPLSPGSLTPTMVQLEQEFRLPTGKLHELVKHFVVELERGLEEPGRTIKALPSYVTRLPNGNERGTYLALDLGGTNLRVCEVVLEGRGKFRMRQKKFTVSEEVYPLAAR